MKYLAVLGRQPELSLAELRTLYDSAAKLIGPELALFNSATPPQINRLGGTLKLARELPAPLMDFFAQLPAGKLTLGLSDYSRQASISSVRREAMKIKKILVRHGRSVRILANNAPALSTATCHHNQLGEKSGHLELIKLNQSWYLGCGVQNITAYARRDQARPARDAKVGMLPPKLAQILINLCGPLPSDSRLLDPFCGTGVVLQEAALIGYRPYGTDLNPRMVEYTARNLQWLKSSSLLRQFASSTSISLLTKTEKFDIIQGDATNFVWTGQIDAVASETYLGPPMSAPPAEIKLKTVKQECTAIILGFLKNIAPRINPGTPLALAIPAWLRPDGSYSRLNLLDEVQKLGYNVENIGQKNLLGLLYYREGQIVAREIIVLRK